MFLTILANALNSSDDADSRSHHPSVMFHKLLTPQEPKNAFSTDFTSIQCLS